VCLFPFTFTLFEVSSQALSNFICIDKIFNCNKYGFNMSGQSDDQEFSDVELSKTSDESNEHNTQEEQALSTEPFLFSGLVPAAEPILLSGLISTDESSSTAELGWTTEPTSSNQPPPTTQPMDSSSTRNSTYIHPVSEGGSVTWTDHNGFVYHKGNDRGPRVPAPTLPDNYKSKGPLPNFPFHLLRGNNVSMQLL
jgi:hypothetical protein